MVPGVDDFSCPARHLGRAALLSYDNFHHMSPACPRRGRKIEFGAKSPVDKGCDIAQHRKREAHAGCVATLGLRLGVVLPDARTEGPVPHPPPPPTRAVPLTAPGVSRLIIRDTAVFTNADGQLV